VLAVVLRSSDAPALNRQQLQMVIRCHRAYVMYQRQRQRLHDSDDDDGPEDEDAWLFEDLSVLTKLYARLRDRQQIIELIFEVGHISLAGLGRCSYAVFPRARLRTCSRTSSRFSTPRSRKCTRRQASPTPSVTCRRL
jgi:hypothetical protein